MFTLITFPNNVQTQIFDVMKMTFELEPFQIIFRHIEFILLITLLPIVVTAVLKIYKIIKKSKFD